MASIFSAPKPPPPPPPPAPMPTTDDAAVAAAKKKQIQMASAKSGRASTILTDFGAAKTDKFGG